MYKITFIEFFQISNITPYQIKLDVKSKFLDASNNHFKTLDPGQYTYITKLNFFTKPDLIVEAQTTKASQAIVHEIHNNIDLLEFQLPNSFSFNDHVTIADTSFYYIISAPDMKEARNRCIHLGEAIAKSINWKNKLGNLGPKYIPGFTIAKEDFYNNLWPGVLISDLQFSFFLDDSPIYLHANDQILYLKQTHDSPEQIVFSDTDIFRFFSEITSNVVNPAFIYGVVRDSFVYEIPAKYFFNNRHYNIKSGLSYGFASGVSFGFDKDLVPFITSLFGKKSFHKEHFNYNERRLVSLQVDKSGYDVGSLLGGFVTTPTRFLVSKYLVKNRIASQILAESIESTVYTGMNMPELISANEKLDIMIKSTAFTLGATLALPIIKKSLKSRFIFKP